MRPSDHTTAVFDPDAVEVEVAFTYSRGEPRSHWSPGYPEEVEPYLVIELSSRTARPDLLERYRTDEDWRAYVTEECHWQAEQDLEAEEERCREWEWDDFEREVNHG